MTQNSKYDLVPKSKWGELNLTQLIALKSNLVNVYYDMKSCGSSSAANFLTLGNEVQSLIDKKENENFNRGEVI